MTTLSTASSLAQALTAEALSRARRRLLTAYPDPTRANTPTSGNLTDDQLRVLAASDWAPPCMTTLDAKTLATADAVTRALLAESMRETLERRLAAERPHGTYDDTRAGHDAFSRGVTDDYDHGNHHLARATIRLADPGLVTRAGLSVLALPGTDAPIIDELAQASDTNPITRVLADAALLDLDRYATGRGLRYSRVGTTLMLAAPTEQRLTGAIDTIAAAAINTGARVTDLTAQYIDDEKALASVGIDPWTTRPSDDLTGQANRILYVGRDGARIHVKAGRIIVDAPGALPATCPTLPCPTGTPSSCPNASVRCTPPGSNHPSASHTRPPTSGPAWRWTSWNSSAHSWSTRPSWRSCARANFGPNTASSSTRPGECGWEPTARKSSSTRTRPPVSDPSLAPCPDTRDRGAATSPTPRRCWRAPSLNLTTSGAGSPGDDLHHRLRHRRQQT